jgi:UDP-glucose 4-epimerase
MKKIIVTGGAGYIGSHCVVSLAEHGFTPIILDNFSNSHFITISKLEKIIKKKVIFYKVDLRNTTKMKSIFKQHLCHAVIHCAGLKSVSESIKIPLAYFENNIQSTLSLINCMQERKIFKLIFSSSATVYNSDNSLPWKEVDKVGKTTNPYGTSKYIIERILKDIANSDARWSIGIARYFNPIANHSSGLIEENPRGIPGNLIPYIVQVAKKNLPYLKIFGNNYNTRDGTCIRDYIHVMDLAEGHVAILKKNKLINGFEVYNFGTGKGSTVLEVVKAFENETGINIPIKFTSRRKGDVPISFCSPAKAYQQLSWKPIRNLNQAMIDIKTGILRNKYPKFNTKIK